MLSKYKKTILSLLLTVFIGTFLFALPVQAQIYKEGCKEEIDIGNAIRTQVYIPGVTESKEGWALELAGASFKCVEDKKIYFVKDLRTYIQNIYTFFIGLIALAAVVMIMVGGFMYVLAAGNQSRIGTARSIISGALGGLVLSLLSYTLLNAINPRITELQLADINEVTGINRAVFCTDLPEKKYKEKNFTPAFESNISEEQEERYREEAFCGKPYFVPGNKEKTTCLGTYCEGAFACSQGDCVSASVAGTYKYKDDRYIDNNLDLLIICKRSLRWKNLNPYLGEFGSYDINKTVEYDLPNNKVGGEKGVPYAIPDHGLGYRGGRIPLIPDDYCDITSFPGETNNDPKLFLGADINDRNGDDDYYYIAPDKKDGEVCSKPLFLCKKGSSVKLPAEGKDNCTQGWTVIAKPGDINEHPEVLYGSTRLWTKADMQSLPEKCEIEINEGRFPSDYQFPPGAGQPIAPIGLDHIYSEPQWNDAMPRLKELLNVLNEQISAKVTSISDDKLYGLFGSLFRCKPWERPFPAGNCSHGVNSAHYGGTNTTTAMKNVFSLFNPHFEPVPASCAADLVPTNGNYAALETLLNDLKTTGLYNIRSVLNEGDHIHVSVFGCGVN